MNKRIIKTLVAVGLVGMAMAPGLATQAREAESRGREAELRGREAEIRGREAEIRHGDHHDFKLLILNRQLLLQRINKAKRIERLENRIERVKERQENRIERIKDRQENRIDRMERRLNNIRHR